MEGVILLGSTVSGYLNKKEDDNINSNPLL